MDLSPKYTGAPEEQVIEHTAEDLSHVAIVYPADMINGLSKSAEIQIFQSLRKIKTEELTEERYYAFPVRLQRGIIYFRVCINMVDIDTARIWEIDEISQNDFLDFVTIKKAIL